MSICMLRAALSLAKVSYDAATGAVIYRSFSGILAPLIPSRCVSTSAR